MDPTHYLSSTYYEHWLAALETLAVEKGVLTPEELATGIAQEAGKRAEGPLPPEAVPAVVQGGAPCNRTEGRLTPRFSVGDQIRARNLNPTGHTRLPRYVRGKSGTIAQVHGTFVYPDTNAHGQGEQPQPLYSSALPPRNSGVRPQPRQTIYISTCGKTTSTPAQEKRHE